MRTRLSALAIGALACLPATAAANASAVCTPEGGVEVRLEHFVAGRTVTVQVVVGSVTTTVTFTGPAYSLVVPGPTPAAWTGTVTWQGTRGSVVVPLAGPACPDQTYRPVPEPTPVPPSSPPVVADTTPPVTGGAVSVPPPLPSPPIITPPPPVGPPVVRRWPAIPCRPGRIWGRRADRVVYRCRLVKPRIPAVTG